MIEELMRIFSSFEFASPLYFWVGGAAIIFLIFFPILRAKKNLRWDRGYWIKKVPELKRNKSWLLFILVSVTSLLIVAALADPQIVEKRNIPLHGKPVMVLFDVSGSINPGPLAYGYDYVPGDDVFSAFEAGRDVYHDIIRRDMGATIGLMIFSDQSYIARDFTERLELLSDTIENEGELQEISMGTMTAEALFNARLYFSQKVKTENKAIILISDLIDDPNSVSQEMKQVLEDGINLYVIAVTEEPAPAYQSIQTLKSRIGSSKAKMIWFKDEGGVGKICEEISKMETSQTGEVEILSRRSLVPFIMPSILGLIILSLVLSETVFRKIPEGGDMKKKWLISLFVLAIVFVGVGLYLQEGPRWTKNTYYDYYNRGVSAYLENQVEKSLNDFVHVANNSKDLWLKSLALGQIGTIIGGQAFDEDFSAESRYQIAQYSIEILKEAVISNPENKEAKYNLELLMNQLPNLLQKMEEEEGDGSGEEPSSDPGYSHGGGERGY